MSGGAGSVLGSFFQIVLVGVLGPLLVGWVNWVRGVLSNRKPPSVIQPFRDLFKLFRKETIRPSGTSALFGLAPYVVFSAMVVASLLIPVVSTVSGGRAMGDAIVLVGLFALARVFMALAAMDTGTPFGGMGGRREMMVGFLAEPATILVLFTTYLLSHSTMTGVTSEVVREGSVLPTPSLVFGALAYFLILLGENSRIPIDNPATHLELTMIHEAMLLEYSGRNLALMEWGSSIKLLLYLLLGISFFLPWGMSGSPGWQGDLLALAALGGKLVVAGAALALFETLMAKLRIFRVPEFMTLAFLLAILGFLSHFILEV